MMKILFYCLWVVMMLCAAANGLPVPPVPPDNED
jgi:hypothetical protein